MTETDDALTRNDQHDATDETELRQKAAKRSCMCPGAGFALMGNSPWALATFVVTLCGLPAVAWLAYDPSSASFWTTIAFAVIGTLLWVAEQVAVRKAAIRTPGPSLLVRGYIPSTCLMGAALVAILVLLLTAFGALQMASSGMSPTLKKGERLLYHKHVNLRAVKPGTVIAYTNSDDSGWGEPGLLLVSRILAGPGDSISIENGRYLVNGEAGPQVADTGRFPVVLDIPSAPDSLTIPDSHYFIVQETPTGGFDSRVLSWVLEENIVATRLWYLSSRGIGKLVE